MTLPKDCLISRCIPSLRFLLRATDVDGVPLPVIVVALGCGQFGRRDLLSPLDFLDNDLDSAALHQDCNGRALDPENQHEQEYFNLNLTDVRTRVEYAALELLWRHVPFGASTLPRAPTT